MSASDIAERLKSRHAYEAKHYPPPDDLWLQAAAEIISLRADITGLEDGNMTWMCDQLDWMRDQLDKAKAENAAQAVELERMREALGSITAIKQHTDENDPWSQGWNTALEECHALARQGLGDPE